MHIKSIHTVALEEGRHSGELRLEELSVSDGARLVGSNNEVTAPFA